MSIVYNQVHSLIHSKSNSPSYKNLQIYYPSHVRAAARPQWDDTLDDTRLTFPCFQIPGCQTPSVVSVHHLQLSPAFSSYLLRRRRGYQHLLHL